MTTDTSAPRSTPAYPGHQPGTETVYKGLKKAGRPGGIELPDQVKGPPSSPTELTADAYNELSKVQYNLH